MSAQEPPTIPTKSRPSGSARSEPGGVVPGPSTPEAPAVAGYTLHKLIGKGGMGEVWEATEHRFERLVALKLHTRALEGTDPFSEAKLAAKVAHPGIVPVHDVGTTLDGRPFYTMDLVEGTELRALMQDGPMPPAQVAALGAALADAVDAAHRRGIVHCDLKPGNIMVDERKRVRVLDFGLAGAIVGRDRGAMAAGTPPYMSPEQVAGLPVGTATDIYSVGVVLFQMLTGRLPFGGDTLDELIGKIISEPASPPSRHVRGVPLDLDRIVSRCLEKRAEDRFASARALADALQAFVEGRPIEEEAARYVPKPSADDGPGSLVLAPPDRASLHFRWSWNLASQPEEIWPFVANTERFNKASGLPAVDFEDHAEPDGFVRRTGTLRALGMTVRWDEHPFEWTRFRGHSVYRAYSEGPLLGLWNRVALSPREGGGTELVHEIWVEPRGWFGKLAATFEIKWKAGRRFDRVYRRVDAFLTGSRGVDDDAFEAPHRPSSAEEAIVHRGASALRSRGFSEGLVGRIQSLLLHAPDKQLERLRPFELADRWETVRAETLDAFIHAADLGLLDLGWDLLCTSCMLPHQTTSSLSLVESRGSCTACNRHVDRDLSCSVELIFRPHPSVRRVSSSTYCVGAPALRPHVVAQQVVRAGETRTLSVVMERGEYRVAGPRLDSSFVVSVSPSGYAPRCDVTIGADRTEGSPAVVRSGDVTWTVHNESGVEQVVRLEQVGRRDDAVTACVAMSHSTFMDLFPREVVAPTGQLTVSRIAFLWVRSTRRFEMIRERGDGGAFALQRRVEELIGSVVSSHHGAVVSTSDDPHLASFASEEDAVAAAIALVGELRGAELEQYVRLAVHAGRCIAIHRVGRVGYFGETLLRGAALLADAPEGGLAVSGEVGDLPRPASLLYGAGAVVETSSGEPYAGRRMFRLGRLSREC